MIDTGKVRAGVVGIGHLGHWHAQKYLDLKEAELTYICDVREDHVKQKASEFGCSYVTDYRQLVGKVDVVTVASTTMSHYEVCRFLLENGIHVHVEKPMTSTSEEGRDLCRIAENKRLKLQVGHVERFNPALIAAREKLETPLFIECHRLAPFKPRGVDVNVVLDLMIHDIDVVLSLVKSPVKAISAVGTPVLTKTTDIANARVEFESGAVANITASRVSQRSERKFRVFQKNQYLSIDFGSGEVNLLTKTGDWQSEEIPIEAEAWSLEKGDALLEETRAFCHSVLNDVPCIVSGRDGLVALRVAEDIMKDIERRSDGLSKKLR